MKALAKSPFVTCTLQAVGYLALALALGLWAANLARSNTQGEFTPPLDDTYIYLQYARSASQGAPLEYQIGESPTRGATSLLYPFLLAPFVPLTSPNGLVWVAWAYGVLFLGLLAWLTHRFAVSLDLPGWPLGL
ncbi:MAG: hypothetical protein HKN21_05825, partial [Candidatus Eisenbacteria bacterium]|nr:hypothetical protein [Candidatus Eisenbacteria bacterium]